MDLDTVKYMRDLLYKGDSDAVIRILSAEIDDAESDEKEDEGHETEAQIDRHTETLRGD